MCVFVAAAQSCAPISVFVKQVFPAPLLQVLFPKGLVQSLFVAAAQSCAPISVFVKQVFPAPLLQVLFPKGLVQSPAVPSFVLVRSLVGFYITKSGLLEGVALKLGPEFSHRVVQMAAHVNVALVRQAAQIESLELSLCEQLPATGVRVVL